MPDASALPADRRKLRLLFAMRDDDFGTAVLGALGRVFDLTRRRAASPDAVRAALAQDEWDLVLCDPEAYECGAILASLRQNAKGTPFVAVTSNWDRSRPADLLRNGARAALDAALLGQLVPVIERELKDTFNRRAREIWTLLEFSPDPILIAGLDGRIVRANRLLEDLLGYAEGELAGESVERLVPDRARERHVKHRERFAAEPYTREMGIGLELSALRKDGGDIPVEISLRPIRVDGDAYVCCALRDLRERKRAENLLRAILEGTAAETGEAFMRALVRNLSRALGVRYAFAGEFVGAQRERASVRAFWNGTDFQEPFEYALAGTPCEVVRADSECLVRERVQQEFPDDPDLIKAGAECYFGVRLHSSSGSALGLIAIMDVKPLAHEGVARTVLRIFAARAAAELERMQASASLAANEQRLKALLAEQEAIFDNTLAGIVYWRAGRIVRCNRAFADFVAQGIDDLIGRDIRALFPSDDACERFTREVTDRLARDGQMGDEKQIWRRGGGMIWIAFRAAPLDRADSSKGIVLVAVDITERKRAEEALRESEERFRDLTELSSDYYWEQDEQFRFVRRVSTEREKRPALEEVLGMTRWEMPAVNFAPGDWARHRADLQAHREFHDLEIERRLGDGATRWVSVCGRPIYDADGRFRGYRGIGRDITERKRFEAALRKSEERFRAAFEQAAVGMALRGLDGRWLDVNQKLCDILGYTRDELLKLTSVEITPPDERGTAIDYNERILGGEVSTYSREKRYLRKDGAPVWVNLTVGVVQGPDGKPDHLISAIEDISQRKQAEEALRAREAELRLITDNVAAMIAYHDAELRYRYVNRRYAEFFDVAPDRLVGRTIAEHIGNELWQKIGPFWDRALSGESVRYVRPHRRHDGSVRHLEVSVVPDREKGGRVVGIYALVLDVTERHLAEEAVRESAARLRLIADNVPAMIAYIDAAFRFRYANRQYVEFYGGANAALEGKALAEVLEPATLAAIRPGIERALSGETVQFEAIRRRRDGTLRTVEVALVPHRGGAGAVPGVYCFILDVTERRRAEETERARAALEAANEELNAFAYTVAHDLRAPLRAITGFAGILRESEGQRLSADGARDLSRIEGSARKLHDLVEGLLRYARAAQSDFAVEELDLGALAVEVADELRPLYPAADITIGALPRAWGDRLAIRAVLANLVGNALKFSAKRERPRVEIGLARTEHGDAVYVRDNGAGFDPRYAAKLFGVFARLHPESEFPGSGVGLAFARRVLARHGGRIWAESAPGEGATFYFTLGARTAG
jgi:PAS domain S-box-containing protein